MRRALVCKHQRPVRFWTRLADSDARICENIGFQGMTAASLVAFAVVRIEARSTPWLRVLLRSVL